jgi:hypothetical protein
MKMKVKLIVTALGAAGLVSSVQPALADTITGPVVVPALPQSVAPGTYTVAYPVVVTPTGGTPQALTFTYNSTGFASTNGWQAATGWQYLGQLNNDANTAVFGTKLADGSNLSIALSSTGQTQFVPGQKDSTVAPGPSVGLTVTNKPVGSPALPGFGASTATGSIDGRGATTATLVAAPTSVQVVGLDPGGVPPASATVGTGTVTPTSATATPGYAVGSVAVNSNQPNQSIGWGQYTVTVPKTNTPTGTTTVAATLAGSSGSVGANGIKINNISGKGTYNVNTGDINATPVETAVFSVDTSGNTVVGGTLTANGGITNNGALTNNGNATVTGNATVGGTLAVSGATTTKGITNTGALSTTTLAVSGATTTTGITNTGDIKTTTLATTGNATVGGNLNVTGTATLGGNSTLTGNTTIGGTLGVTGATTLNGATQINNTLGVTGATTIGSASGTGGNTVKVDSSGIVLSTSGVGANSVAVTSAGTVATGGGASMRLANGVATFAGANSAPIRVTGVLDGQDQYDAVNRGQLNEVEKKAKRSAAGAAALVGIPQVEQGKNFNIGVGVGGVESEAAFAVGGSARIARDFILKGGVGFTNDTTTWTVGGGWSW